MPQKKTTRREVQATVETTIVVCQCGSATFDVDSQTKTAVALSCSKCGCKTSVKGPVGLVNVPAGEIAAAVKSPVRPDPDYEPSKNSKEKKKDKEDKEDDKKYTMLRFRVLIDAKEKVIDRAMLASRVMNCADPNFKAQVWQGHSLEYMAADFLSGCDPAVLEVVNEIESEAEEAAKEAEAAGKNAAAVSRKVRETRQRVMEKGAAQIGIIEPGGKDTPPLPGIEAKPEDDDGLVPDGGRLVEAVKKTLIEYAEEHREDTGKTIGLLMDVPVHEAVKRSKKDGGFVIMVTGDQRTKNVGGMVPSMCFWMSMEPNDKALEFEIEYSDLFEADLPTAEMKILEMLPASWDNMAKAKRWPMPSFCGGREMMVK